MFKEDDGIAAERIHTNLRARVDCIVEPFTSVCTRSLHSLSDHRKEVRTMRSLLSLFKLLRECGIGFNLFPQVLNKAHPFKVISH
jgi:hypothetical protein